MKNNSSVRKQLHETALNAPVSSGVYIWRDEQNTILYIGKARNLKNRLSSYFSGQKDIKTRILVSRAYSIEYITTGNEYEAFLLENTLIKKHSPRFNIELKDDKSYPALRITNEDFPRVFKTRHIVKDNSRYYGPYPNVSALDTFIDTLYRLYPLRHCKKFRKRNAPCMYYHIGRCSAPCCGKISRESYIEYIDEISCFLDEKPKETVRKLEVLMKEAAASLRFEKAARLRDGIAAVKILYAQNTVAEFSADSRDYIGYWAEGPLASFIVLKMRDGKLVAKDTYRTQTLREDSGIIAEFFAAYYAEKEQIPPRIFVPEAEGLDFAVQHISEQFGIQPEITVVPMCGSGGALSDCCAEDGDPNPNTPDAEQYPQSEQKADSLDEKHTSAHADIAPIHVSAMNMARNNAREDIIRRMRERGDKPAMEELRRLLDLPHLPVRIEGFDIAHIGGKFPVASLITFYNGSPDKKNYRYFRLKTTDGVIDDFASMREAAARRYTRLLNEQAELPDLIMIDGGIGQVNAVKSVLSSLKLDIPIVGLAKRDEELYLPGNSTPIRLPRRSDALRLLQRVRDETHRFATKNNQNLRTKEITAQKIDAAQHVPGAANAESALNAASAPLAGTPNEQPPSAKDSCAYTRRSVGEMLAAEISGAFTEPEP